MTSLLAAPLAVAPRGVQEPRICTGPDFVSTAGDEAIDLARHAGLFLDPWQQLVLRQALGEAPNGKWAAFEVGLLVSRQSGKGSILEARELWGLFLGDEKLIMHSAHEYKTAAEAFLRIRGLIENTPDLAKRVKTIRTSHGEEGIELKSGARLRFVARSKGSGRGFSGDCVVLDEAMRLPEAALTALMPTMSARPNPQLWYTSSAGDAESVVLGRVVRRGRAGDPGLAYMEWSVDEDDYDPDDPQAWALANPGLGIRISAEHVARERRAMDSQGFARERLGVGNYPPEDDAVKPIPDAVWKRCGDPASKIFGPVAFAIDMTLDRSRCSIASSGAREDGKTHVELIDARLGTEWVVARAKELSDRWEPVAFVVDPGGPAGSLIPDLQTAGVPLHVVTMRELAQACGAFRDAAINDELRQLPSLPLTDAVAGAKTRVVSDLWLFDRRTVADSSPLLAATLARHGFTSSNNGPSVYERRDLIVL